MIFLDSSGKLKNYNLIILSYFLQDVMTQTKGKLIKPENTLKKKVGNGGIDQVALEKAQYAIDNNSVDFRPIALGFVAEIDSILRMVPQRDLNDPQLLGEVTYPVMQLKAQGGLFHYPLISKVSHILTEFFDNVGKLDDVGLQLLTCFRHTIDAIVRHQLKNENSPQGMALSKALNDACERYYRRYEII